LLLLLAEASAHGYELIERLRPFGFELSDPATVYRTLRQIEEHGLVRSRWELTERGPARRVYTITADGLELLAAWSETLRATRRVLEEFLARVEQLRLADGRV
jgi:poly-beta-hydroxybutyrate-responsive repressor